MPVVDYGATALRAGLYAAVRDAVDAELDRHQESGLAAPAVWGQWCEASRAEQPVTVPAYLLPASARPRIEAGHHPMVALVSPDGRLSFRVESPAETLARCGI